MINKKTAPSTCSCMVGYLAAKVSLLILRQAVGILISGVDSVKLFFHSSYSRGFLLSAPSSASLYYIPCSDLETHFDVTDIDVTAIDGRYPSIVIDIDTCARGSLNPRFQ